MLYGKFYPHGLYLFVVSLFRLAIFMLFSAFIVSS